MDKRLWIAASSAIALVLAAAACSSGSASSPQSTSVAGDWRGTTQDSAAGTGQLAFTLDQKAQIVSGSWSVTYANHSFNDGGSVAGTASGPSVQMTFAPASPNPCMTQVSGTISADARRMTGSYNNGSCPFKETGTFSATKQ